MHWHVAILDPALGLNLPQRAACCPRVQVEARFLVALVEHEEALDRHADSALCTTADCG